MPRLSIVFYISGHGFGHAARSIEVINAILAARPETAVIVRTSAARWLFDLTVRGPVEFHAAECDTGVWQFDSLHLDEGRTLERARAFDAGFAARVEEEVSFLRGVGATSVVADVPPLAFAAASAAGLPSIALGNFTWDWIYADYLDRERPPGSRDFLRTIEDAYRQAALVLRLPMWGGFEAFTAPIVDLPFVARHSQHEPTETKAHLGLSGDWPLVLVSFGGHDLRSLDLGALARLHRYRVILTGLQDPSADIPSDSSLVWVDEANLYRRGFRYEDLVRACDVVATKPGYGIIAECLANETAMLYTSRGRFREYEVLVEAMPRFLCCRFIEQEALQAGRWEASLDALLAQPARPARPATNGAEVAAATILELAG
jgi:L-arabinokinase